MREQLNALEADARENARWVDALAKENGALRLRSEANEAELRPRILPEVRGVTEWQGSEEQRAELLNTAAWQAKYMETYRELEEFRKSDVPAQHVRYLNEKVGRYETLIANLLEDRVERGCSRDCDRGWVTRTCGEDTCVEIDACEECNTYGLRVSWDDRLEMEAPDGSAEA